MAVKIQTRLSDFSPIICRLMARNVNGRSVAIQDDVEIFNRCKRIDLYDIISLQWKPSWHGVDIYHALDFMQGCGIDINNAKEMDKHSKYLRGKPRWSHLKRHEEWKPRWLKMLIIQRAYNDEVNRQL